MGRDLSRKGLSMLPLIAFDVFLGRWAVTPIWGLYIM